MTREPLVAVSYPVDEEFTRINTGVLGGCARVAFLHGRPEGEFREVLRQADVLIGWHLGGELPAGTWPDSPRLRFVQLLSAGADSVDFAAIPERLALASNVGAYAAPMAEYVMAVTLALARRLPQRHADLARGESGQAPAGSSARRCQPMSTSAWRRTSRNSSSGRPCRKATRAQPPSTPVLIRVNSSSTG